MKLSKILLVSIIAISLTLPALAEAARPKVQIAVLLDTSSSMDGLIDQAKTQLWKIVNEFIASKKAGSRPLIEVALMEYGKDSLPASDGYIRIIQHLTTDLDKVSEELFALRTNGGHEFCGQVISVATQKLEWSKRPGDLKVIVIAGNEAFNQGNVSYKISCKQAIRQGIMINTIFCGKFDEGVRTFWKEGAILADGHFMNIDQNRRAPQIAAPQDAEIARLGGEMNKTYIGYGKRGRKAKMRQAAQDSNAKSAAPAAMAERAVYKSSAAYSNSGWDLADAVKDKKVKLDEMEADDLPEPMRKMDNKEREAYVKAQSAKRAEIQKKIQKLSVERKKYVTQKQKEQAKSGTKTLDAAMIDSIRSQAVKKGYKFE